MRCAARLSPEGTMRLHCIPCGARSDAPLARRLSFDTVGFEPLHSSVMLQNPIIAPLGSEERPSPMAMLRSPLMPSMQSRKQDSTDKCAVTPMGPRGVDGAPRSAGSAASEIARRCLQQRPTWLTPSRYEGYIGSDYSHVGYLGRGAFGLVELMREEVSGMSVAMKTIDRGRLHTEPLRRAAMREVRILRHLSEEAPHHSIVRLLDVVDTPQAIHLVLEHCDGGTMAQLIEREGALREATARHFARPLLDAVAHLHGLRICHRDLKNENFLLCGGNAARKTDGAEESTNTVRLPSVRIIDFGLSVVMNANPEKAQLSKVAGSLFYMAPEMIARRGYRGECVDVWALGVSFAAMLVGEFPFDAPNDAALARAIVSNKRASSLPRTLSSASRALVDRMLDPDPEKRIGTIDAQAHPWLCQENEVEE